MNIQEPNSKELDRKAKRRASSLRYSQSPKGKAKRKACDKRYSQSPKGKAKNKRYEQSPKGKAKNKRYEQSPKGKAKRKAKSKAIRKRYEQSPKGISPRRIIGKSMRTGIGLSLKSRGSSKNRRHWETLVGYSLKKLVKHLTALFEPEMTMENYGKYGWHIDHFIPHSSFCFTSTDDIGFKHCWALKNLQPRWATTAIARRHGSNSIGNVEKQDNLALEQERIKI